MGSPGEQTDRIEALRRLMDRLSAPDLTLAEAKELRPCLVTLLERADAGRGPSRSPGHRGYAGPRDR